MNAAGRTSKGILLVALGVMISPPLLAETELPQVIVTATKQERPQESVAASVTVVTREEMAAQGASTVPEVLQNVSGINVTSAGSTGDDVDVRLRGADRDEVLIMIDGVAINNVGEHRALFLGAIPLDNVQRIEIVRGSQGVLYGSDAVGGVINIITRKGAEGHTFSATIEGGNLQTFREMVDAVGGAGKARYSASFSRTDRRGRFDRDRFGEFALSANFGYRILPEVRLETGVNYIRDDQNIFYEFQTGFDPVAGVLLVRIDPDNDNRLHRDLATTRLSVKALPKPWWNVELLHGFLADLEDLTNSSAGDTAPTGFAPNDQDFTGTGLVNTIDLRNFFVIHESPKFTALTTVGFEFQDERLHFTDPASATVFPAPGQQGDRQNYAPYLQQEFRLFDESLLVTGGARFDHNTTFGDQWSPAASVLYRLKKTGATFRASYGEGFHGPTILEFFDQLLLQLTGDPSFQAVRLQAELSQSYEAGIEQAFGKWGTASATFFYIDYDRLFDGLQFMNDAFSAGIELGAAATPLDWLTVGGNYTFLKAIDEDSGGRLADRPRHQGNFFVQARPIPPLTIRADLNVVGSRAIPSTLSTAAGDLGIVFIDPNGNTSVAGTIPGYVKADLAASYEFLKDRLHIKSWKAYFKIENLLDDSHQEKFGFPAPGITFLAGTTAAF